MNKNYRIYLIISIVLILLTISSGLTALLMKDDKWHGFYSGLTGGLITTLLSLFFITIIIEENRKRIEEENRKVQEEEILNNKKKNIELIHSLFDNQYGSMYQHLQEVFKENYTDEVEDIKENFPFKKLKKIFDQNMIIRYGIENTNLQVFYHNFNKYIEGLRLIVTTTDFSNQFELKKTLVNYLNFLDAHDIELFMLYLNQLMNLNPDPLNLKAAYYVHIEDDNNILNPNPKLVFSLTGVLYTIINNTVRAKNIIDQYMKNIDK